MLPELEHVKLERREADVLGNFLEHGAFSAFVHSIVEAWLGLSAASSRYATSPIRNKPDTQQNWGLSLFDPSHAWCVLPSLLGLCSLESNE